MRLRPLLTGEMAAPVGYLERRPSRLAFAHGLGLLGGRREWMPIPAFLVEHPEAGPILIDTGLHESLLESKSNFGRGARIYGVRVSEGQAVKRRLAERGIDAASIGTVVMTHLHVDHASAVEDFPDATFVVDRREWAAATAPRGTLRGYVPSQFEHERDWRSLDFDGPGVEAFASFGRTVDLLGDGSIRLLSTPGHTPGHMSVLLRLRHREALLTIDAAYTRRTISETAMPLLTADEHRFRRSLAEIQRYVAHTPGSLVIPGHDAGAWAELDDVYV